MPVLKVSILASVFLAVITSFTLALLAFGDAFSTLYFAGLAATAISLIANSWLGSKSSRWAKRSTQATGFGLVFVGIAGFILAVDAVSNLTLSWTFLGKAAGALYLISAVATWALIYADDHVKPQATHR